MTKRKSVVETHQKGLDRFSPKRARGRPATVVPSAIWGRADNYRGILRHVWGELSPLLLESNTEDDVIKAFQIAIPGGTEFPPHAALILRILKDRMFPKRDQARINFLADSLASVGLVSPRRSRDICRAERVRERRAHHILRAELYVECSCGYKGHSVNHACRRCGTEVPPWLIPGWSLT